MPYAYLEMQNSAQRYAERMKSGMAGWALTWSRYSVRWRARRRGASLIGLALMCLHALCLTGCGLHFAGGPADNPLPQEIKTILLDSAVNNTTVTGIETELTNDIRAEFALDNRLTPVRSGGDAVLRTTIASYTETDSTFRADGKELTRIGTLNVNCVLSRNDNNTPLWKKEMSASNNYNVTDTITDTLTNRRMAISRMIRDIAPRIPRSMFNNF